MPVRIPLDKICVRTGVFCPRCQRLLDEGKYSDVDVKVMEVLVEAERKYRDYDIRFEKAYQFDDIVYVLLEAKPGIPSGLGGEIARKLRDLGIQRVVLVQYMRDPRKIIEQVIQPYPLLGVEEAYLPDGSTVAVIKVPKEARSFLESFKGRLALRLAEKLLGKQVYVEYVDAKVETLKPEWLGITKADPKKLFDRL